MTTNPRHPRTRVGEPFVCKRCGGPCRQYAGHTHQWTCRPCLTAYINSQVDPADKTANRRIRQIAEKG